MNLDPDAQSIDIPDEAIVYIMNRYMQRQNGEGTAPIVVGIPTRVVEDVLQLFIDWAANNGHVKNNMLIIGGSKID